jgi:cysteine desulfurase
MSATTRYYFDWAATAIPDTPSGTENGAFANPSSRHFEGRAAKAALEDARVRCAAVLGVPPQHLYFTAGATESNATVLYATLLRQSARSILFSAAEHPSIRENCTMLERLGKKTGVIGVEKDGRVTEELFRKALEKQPDARFAALMAVNNETGAISDIPALVRLVKDRDAAPVSIHCDIVQAIGKTPLDLAAWDVDSAALSAHKIGGPRGSGLLYLKTPLKALYTGGGQEGGVRPGTENTAGALALAACMERHAVPAAVTAASAAAAERFARLLTFLHATERCFIIPVDRKAADPRFSPYIVQAGFRNIPGAVMVRALDDAGFAVSTGSACSSSSPERPVLAAMGVGSDERREGIRISQGWSTTLSDIDALIETIRKIIAIY